MTAALVALFGCKGAERISVEPPADVELAVVVSLGPDGTIEQSTPLLSWDPALPLPVIGRGTQLVLGYTKAELEPYGALTDPNALAQVLRPAVGCQPTLPNPTWMAELDKDGLTQTSSAIAPALTAAWLDDKCPGVRSDSDLGIDLRCDTGRCRVSTAQTGECSLRADLSACGLGIVRATQRVDGSICLDFDESPLSCEPSAQVEFTDGSYTCTRPEQCEVHAHLDPKEATRPFEVTSAKVFDADAYTPSQVIRLNTVYNHTVLNGYLHDLAVVGDRVAVAGTRGPSILRDECPIDDRGRRPSTLYFHDVDSMQSVLTATAPDCLTRIVGVGDDALVGTFLEGPNWQIGRFDLDGQLTHQTDTTLIRLRRRDENVQELRHQPTEVVRLSDEIVLVAYFKKQGTTDGDAILQLYRADDLELVDTIVISELGEPYGLVVLSATEIAVGLGLTKTLLVMNTETGAMQSSVLAPTSLRSEIFDGYFHPPSKTLMFGSKGPYQMLNAHEDATDVSRSDTFASDIATISISPLFDDPRLVLVSGVEVGSWTGVITAYDPADRRFLPGVWTLGHGPVDGLTLDRQGRIFGVLPWAAEIVRLSPL